MPPDRQLRRSDTASTSSSTATLAFDLVSTKIGWKGSAMFLRGHHSETDDDPLENFPFVLADKIDATVESWTETTDVATVADDITMIRTQWNILKALNSNVDGHHDSVRQHVAASCSNAIVTDPAKFWVKLKNDTFRHGSDFNITLKVHKSEKLKTIFIPFRPDLELVIPWDGSDITVAFRSDSQSVRFDTGPSNRKTLPSSWPGREPTIDVVYPKVDPFKPAPWAAASPSGVAITHFHVRHSGE